MTNKERFLAGEIFTIGNSIIRYRFDGELNDPGICRQQFPTHVFYFFTLIKIETNQVKWNSMILGQWVKGTFKYSDLKFESDAREGGSQ